MLRSMREAVSSWPMKVLLMALVVSFISFYGWRSGTERPPNAVAEVNGSPIPLWAFHSQYQNTLARYRSMGLLGENVPQHLLSMVESGIVREMVSRRLRFQEAESLGLVPSEAAIRDLIRFQFTAPGSEFDFDLYKRILSYRLHVSPDKFEAAQGEIILADLFGTMLSRTAWVSTAELRAAFEAQNHKVNLTVVETDPSARPLPKRAFTSDEVEAFFEKNRADYRRPEARSLEVLSLDRLSLIDPAEGDMEEKPASPEHARKLAERAREMLVGIKSRAEAGRSLAQVERDGRIRFVKTGLLLAGDNVEGLPDGPQLTRLAFALSEGAVSEPVTGYTSGNLYLIRVFETREALDPPLEQVLKEVEADLASSMRKEEARRYAEGLLERAKTAGGELSAVAKEEKLPLKETGPFARRADNRIPEVGVHEEASAEVFLLTKENPLLGRVVEAEDRFILLSLKERSEPDWEVFERELNDLREMSALDAGQARLNAWVGDIYGKAKIRSFIATDAGRAPGEPWME